LNSQQCPEKEEYPEGESCEHYMKKDVANRDQTEPEFDGD
jgi:hypothetical protein